MNTLVMLLVTSCAPAQYPTMQSSSVPMGTYGNAGDSGWSGQPQESRPRFFARIRGYFRRQSNDQQPADSYSSGGSYSNGGSYSSGGTYAPYSSSSGMTSGSYIGSGSMNRSYVSSPGSMNGQFISSGQMTGSYAGQPISSPRYSSPGMVNGRFLPAQPIPSNSIITSPSSPSVIGSEQLSPVPGMAPAQRMPTGPSTDPF